MSSVDELITWLRAQLDEDERVARAAIEAHDGKATWPIEPGFRPNDRPRWLWLDVMDSTSPETMPPAMAEHMARWDPARVLAEVEAKRHILDELDKRWQAEDPNYDIRRTDDNWANALAFAVKALAQPYAGQPGWREEWAA